MSTNGKTLNFRAAKIKGFTVVSRLASNNAFTLGSKPTGLLGTLTLVALN